jgi:catechol 2,3-dioxygenase-like lactoylglutathione lyase family enzyme
MAEPINYAPGVTLSMSVSDMDRGIAWYEDVLGFKLLYRMDHLGWCELESSVKDVNVGLSVTETPNPGGAVPTFGVADIEDAKAWLESKRVKIDGEVIQIEEMVRLLSFYDLDDNALMFFQMLEGND